MRPRVAWSSDGKTLVGRCTSTGSLCFWNGATGEHRGTLLLTAPGKLFAISSDGNYRDHGSKEAKDSLIAVVQTETDQTTLSLDEFAKRYGWTNDPRRLALVAGH